MMATDGCRWSLVAHHLDDETRVSFRGEEIFLDELDAEPLYNELSRLIEDGGRCHFVLDLSNVGYLTSTILGVFLRLYKTLHSVGGSVVLANVQPQIYEIFRVTRLNGLLDVRMNEGCTA
jgi:anti-sigma B factor antagonist